MVHIGIFSKYEFTFIICNKILVLSQRMFLIFLFFKKINEYSLKFQSFYDLMLKDINFS